MKKGKNVKYFCRYPVKSVVAAIAPIIYCQECQSQRQIGDHVLAKPSRGHNPCSAAEFAERIRFGRDNKLGGTAADWSECVVVGLLEMT